MAQGLDLMGNDSRMGLAGDAPNGSCGDMTIILVGSMTSSTLASLAFKCPCHTAPMEAVEGQTVCKVLLGLASWALYMLMLAIFLSPMSLCFVVSACLRSCNVFMIAGVMVCCMMYLCLKRRCQRPVLPLSL